MTWPEGSPARPHLLIAGCQPDEAAWITGALAGSSCREIRMTAVSTVAEALRMIDREAVSAILVMFRRGGRLGVREARAVVDGARSTPAVWIIDDGDIIDVAEAVAAGVLGAFYRDQLGPELMRAVRRLAPAFWQRSSKDFDAA